MEILITDLECDSLRPTTIHMVGVLDYHSGHFTDYNGDRVAEGLVRISEAKRLIVFNGIGYDIPVIERLTEGLVAIDRTRVIEVLDLSRRLVDMKSHKLAVWGEMLGFPKGDHSDFSRWTPAMSAYCQRDCEITKLVFDLLNELNQENGKPDLLTIPTIL